MSYEEQILVEVKQLPEEQLRNLLDLVRLFRVSVETAKTQHLALVKDGTLHGTVLRNDDPFGPATDPDDWEVLR